MILSEKAKENERIAKKCLDLKAFNVGASRAYYSAFLSIKNFLIINKFDYKSFLLSIKSEKEDKSKEKEFSHGTIKMALVKCILDNKLTIKNMSSFNVLDNLYNKRRIADYEPEHITKNKFEDSLKDLDIILKITGDEK